MSALWSLSFPWYLFVVRGLVVYVAVLVLIRISGKREIGQLGAGEFVAILLVSNAVQNSMNGGDNSVIGGLILATVIVALGFVESEVTYRWKPAARLMESSASILVHNGKIQEANLRRERLRHDDLHRMLRENGVMDTADVMLAILESDGKLSVLGKDKMAD